MAGIAVFFFFTSTGRIELVNENEVRFMTLFLPQIIFGAWAVLSVFFDLVSADREHNVLDCILCSGVTKKQFFYAKIISAAVVSMLLSFIYLFPITVVIALFSDFSNIMLLIRYLIPFWGYIMVFAAIGITISILARSSKVSLIWSLAIGLILMPRFFIIIVEALGSVFHWSQVVINRVSMISPGALMNALANSESFTNFIIAIIVFSAYVLILFSVSYLSFSHQDEYNYGE